MNYNLSYYTITGTGCTCDFLCISNNFVVEME